MPKLTLRPALYGAALGVLSLAMLAGQTQPAAADSATVAMPSGTWSFSPRTVTVNGALALHRRYPACPKLSLT